MPPQYHGFQYGIWPYSTTFFRTDAVIEEVLIPVVDAEGQRLREERRAEHHAEDAVERAPRERASSACRTGAGKAPILDARASIGSHLSRGVDQILNTLGSVVRIRCSALHADTSDAPRFLRITITGEWPPFDERAAFRKQLIGEGQLKPETRTLVDLRGLTTLPAHGDVDSIVAVARREGACRACMPTSSRASTRSCSRAC